MAVVEGKEEHGGRDAPPGNGSFASPDALAYRLDQQRILAEFGGIALKGRDLDPMLHQASVMVARGTRTRFAKFLDYSHGRDKLFVRAGVGWKPGVVGHTEMGADLGSPAGFALKTGEPVISNHLAEESRFRTPQFMADHGIRRAINVLVEVDGEAFGVLEVDSPDEGSFERDDLAFMQGFANLIGVAIERQRAEAQLRDALEHQAMLTREASHRVKNSLALVSAMLDLQMRADKDPRVARMLGDAQSRIAAIALAHDQLWRGDQVGTVALRDLVASIVDTMAQQAPQHVFDCDLVEMTIGADTAIPLGLLVTELMTNAVKYAYPTASGIIAVSVAHEGERLVVRVTDRGVGLPDGFDQATAAKSSLGMRMIASLTRQLSGELRYSDAAPGTIATVTIPL